MTRHRAYPSVDPNPDFAKLEEEILRFWKEHRIFERSVEQRARHEDGKNNDFIFYDGPPFANGLPHYGHLLTGYVKDLIARYQTMRGKRVERRFGWDCHGLPAEMATEKELGISGRGQIIDYGIGKFNDYCRANVMQYTKEWEYYVSRQGRWVDFRNDYKTMDRDFMESVLWAFSELYKQKLVYESFRVMPYSWAAETPVSNFETRIDNATREREDKAVTVAFKLKEKPPGAPEAKNYYILAWTTTPWTLPSNLALAVNSDINYSSTISANGDCLIASFTSLSWLAPQIGRKNSDEAWNLTFAPIQSEELIGLSYEPLFPFFKDQPNAFRIIDGSDFVAEGDGTGIVHIAPGFGEDDQRVAAANGIDVVCPVDIAGRYTDEIFDIPCNPSPASGGSKSEAIRGGGSKLGEGSDSTRNPIALSRAQAMRKDPTDAEKRLWEILSNKKLGGKKFRRQHAIGPYIVDFVSTSADLIIELDGGQHNEKTAAYDAERTLYLQSKHYRVLRFWNHEVLENLEGVVANIEQMLSHPPETAEDAVSTPRQRGMETLSLRGLNVIAETAIEDGDLEGIDPRKVDKFKKDVQSFGLANMRIIRWLRENDHVIKEETIKHNYPHCWRTDTPLIYRAMSSWYVDVQAIKDKMLANNQTIRWIPEHVKNGQMGKGIESAPDWSISRNRFWGTPIPIWRSDNPNSKAPIKVFGSIAELEAFFDKKVEDLHRPYIDELVAPDGEGPNGEKYRYTRVEDVFDCWFESGSMPYAQLHYPFENKEHFEANFPADFITEYVAQTRGWFYTLQVLSAALFKKAPFKNCICHGVVIDEETGLKYSKRLKNYKDPKEVMDQYGADALRWMMVSSPVMNGADLAVDPEGKFIRDVVRLNIKPLWSAYNFFTLYANADNIKAAERNDSGNMLDRYILTKCKAAVAAMRDSLDVYNVPAATDAMTAFLDVLNNWYIRRSRTRFWSHEAGEDKQAAYDTLFTVLNTIVKAAAPLLPFTAEAIYRGLNGEQESVHLQDYPFYLKDDMHLAESMITLKMDEARQICATTLAFRNDRNIRVRQPLSSLTVYSESDFSYDMLGVPQQFFQDIIAEEVNVKKVYFSKNIDAVADKKLNVNARVVGKRLGAKTKTIIPAAKNGDWKILETHEYGPVTKVEVGGEILDNCYEADENGDLHIEFEVLLEPKDPSIATALPNGRGVAVLDTQITAALEEEGVARDFVRLVQQARKDAGFDISDHIALGIEAAKDLHGMLVNHQPYIEAQTLSTFSQNVESQFRTEQTLDGKPVTIVLSRVA